VLNLVGDFMGELLNTVGNIFDELLGWLDSCAVDDFELVTQRESLQLIIRILIVEISEVFLLSI